MYGTGPIGLSEQNLGPHTVIKFYDVQKLKNNIVWDRSHTFIRGMHGTGPMCWCKKPMGLVPWSIWIYKTSITTFNEEVPIMSLNDLWDQSHVCILGIYGTGPKLASQVCMGPVSRCIFLDLWDFERLLEQLSIAWRPMYGSERPKGPVPFMPLR